MIPLNLTLILRLDALCIERLTQWIGVSGLQTVIGTKMDECTILLAKVVVHARSQQPFCRQIAHVGLELEGTRCAASQSNRSIAAPTWTRRAAWARQNIRRTAGSRSTVVEAEDTIVERNLGCIPICSQIRQSSRFKLRAGDIYRVRGGQNYAYAFSVSEEEGVIFNYWSTK